MVDDVRKYKKFLLILAKNNSLILNKSVLDDLNRVLEDEFGKNDPFTVFSVLNIVIGYFKSALDFPFEKGREYEFNPFFNIFHL